MELQVQLSCHHNRFEEAKSEILHAINVFEKLGTLKEWKPVGIASAMLKRKREIRLRLVGWISAVPLLRPVNSSP